jgi:hypothetical protein
MRASAEFYTSHALTNWSTHRACSPPSQPQTESEANAGVFTLDPLAPNLSCRSKNARWAALWLELSVEIGVPKLPQFSLTILVSWNA